MLYVMRKQIRLKIASRCLTFCQEMGEFQKSLTAYKLFGVTRTIGIILNKQCVSLHRWYHKPGGTRSTYDDLWEHHQKDWDFGKPVECYPFAYCLSYALYLWQ